MAKGVSLRPCDAVEGGGLLDDEDIRITEARFTMFDYGGKSNAVPALQITMDRMDGTNPIQQYYSMGKATDWTPADDGKSLLPIGKSAQLVRTSNGMLFMESVTNSGFPEDKLLDGDPSVLDGLECHVNRIAIVREGLSSGKDKTVLTVSKIHRLPWEKETPKGKGKGKSTKAASKGNGKDEDEVQAAAMEFVLGVIAENPDGYEKNKLPNEVFKKFDKADPLRGKLVGLVFKDEFLNTGPWKYEGGKLFPA
jgi:hypothetical protein